MTKRIYGIKTLADLDGQLDELIDVDLTTTPPVEGDRLTYRAGKWVPEEVLGGSGGGVADGVGDIKYVPITGTTDGQNLNEGWVRTTVANDTKVITKTYTLANFVGVGLDATKLRGLFLRTWLMIDNLVTVSPGDVYAKIEATFPDGTTQVIAKLDPNSTSNQDGETGVLVYLPVNGGTQTTVRLTATIHSYSETAICTAQWGIIGAQQALVYVPGASQTVVGEIFAWPKGTPPSGSLECNGAEVSRTTYAELFSIIGTMYGAGDGSTTFKLPDLRGEFIRGWDNGRGKDLSTIINGKLESREIGTHQPGSLIAGDNGSSPADVGSINYYRGNTLEDAKISQHGLGRDVMSVVRDDYSLLTDANTNTPYFASGSENSLGDFLQGVTRPTNVAMMFCIRYSGIVNVVVPKPTYDSGWIIGGISTNGVVTPNSKFRWDTSTKLMIDLTQFGFPQERIESPIRVEFRINLALGTVGTAPDDGFTYATGDVIEVYSDGFADHSDSRACGLEIIWKATEKKYYLRYNASGSAFAANTTYFSVLSPKDPDIGYCVRGDFRVTAGGFGGSATVGGNGIGDLEYVSITGTSDGSNPISQEISTAQTVEHTFQLSSLIGTGYNPANVRSVNVLIRAKITETGVVSTGGGIYVTYPDGSYVLVSDARDDGYTFGSQNYFPINIPINKGQTSFKIKMVNVTSAGTFIQTLSYEIKGVQQIVYPALDADFDYFMAQGQLATGAYIDYTSKASGYFGTGDTGAVDYSDSNGNVVSYSGKNVTTLMNVAGATNLFPQNNLDDNKPLVRPAGCFKSEIELKYRKTSSNGDNSGEEATVKVIIDWRSKKFSCVFEMKDESLHGEFPEFAIFPNLSFGSYQYAYNNSNNINYTGYWSDTPPQIHIDDDRVYKLPCWKTNGANTETNAFNIVVKHYKTVVATSSTVTSSGPVTINAATYTVTESSETVFNVTAASDITLPAGVAGKKYTFVKRTSGKVRIFPAGTNTIADSGTGGQNIGNGDATQTYATITFYCIDGSKWVILGAHGTWVTGLA